MAEPTQRLPPKAPRLLVPLLAYLVVTVAVVAYTRTRPDLYESIAVVQDASQASSSQRTVKLSELTAELVAEDTMLIARWDATEKAVRTRIRNSSVLKVKSDGLTTIRVRTESFPDARDIAKSIAAHYRGSRAEARRRKAPLGALAPLRQPSQELNDLDWLLLALQEQARAAGFDSFGEVQSASKDSARARELLADEEFSHRFRKLRDLRLKLETSTPEATNLHLIGYPPLPRVRREETDASSTTYRSELAFTPPDPIPRRNVPIIIAGQLGALALAALLYFVLGRRKAATAQCV